jgi:iron complex transport system ATP-binding protein
VKSVPRKEDKAAAVEAIQRVGIMHLCKRNYTELSGGEQQLVMIARVLAQQPNILLLDEPTSHLDLTNQSHLLVLLKKFISEGITVISILHDPNLAFLFGDDFIFMHNKTIIRSGEALAPWDKEFLKTIYQGNIQTVPHNDRALLIPSTE